MCVRITVPIRLRYAPNACACILYTHIYIYIIYIYTCVLERIYTYMSVQQFLERDKCSLFYTHTDTHSRVISIVALHHRTGINYSSIYIYIYVYKIYYIILFTLCVRVPRYIHNIILPRVSPRAAIHCRFGDLFDVFRVQRFFSLFPRPFRHRRASAPRPALS